MENIPLKQAMLHYAKDHDIAVPDGFTALVDGWGDPAKKLAERVSSHLGYKPSTMRTRALQQAMEAYVPKAPATEKPKPPKVKPVHFHIKDGPNAYHQSGRRLGSAIHFIVGHDMEVGLREEADEAVGRYFAMAQSGGSTNLGLDNDSITMYLPDNVIPWGAPYANTQGLHVEQMGFAHWSRKEWFDNAEGTLLRMAWLVARKCEKFDLPIKFLDAHDILAGRRGVTDHRQCTKAYKIAGGHTDPGSGYPWEHVLSEARVIARQ